MKVKIINASKHPLPEHKTELSAGMDLMANINEKITLQPLERKLIPTNISIELPAGYEAQIRSRSGMALKFGLICLNSPGTIDADYRGEISIILANISNESVTINDGDRIAQLIIAKHETIEWVETDHLDETERGTKGFGSTGK